MNPRPRLRRRLIDYENSNSLSSRIRRRRLSAVRALIQAAASQIDGAAVTIIDVGGTVSFWRLVGLDLLRSVGAHVTLVNIRPTLIPGDLADLLSSMVADGRDLSRISDRQFALGLSNSVIEHVGDSVDMARFASELRRVARSYYVQTPNFWFPIEPHYMALGIHWAPEPLRARLLFSGLLHMSGRPRTLEQARRAVGGVRLLTARQMRGLFPDAEHSFDWFVGLPKSLIAIRRA